MQPDDELCLCFHVSQRKIGSYIRIEKPVRASQISECSGAGTGCGWCRPFLKKMFDAAVQEMETSLELPTPDDYFQKRQCYLDQQKQNRNQDGD